MIVHRRSPANIVVIALSLLAGGGAFAQAPAPSPAPDPAATPQKTVVEPSGVTIHILEPKDVAGQQGDEVQVRAIGWVKGIRYLLPERWKVEKPSNAMRLVQLILPEQSGSGKGDATLTITGDIGGTVEENLARWVGQFTDIEGAPTQQDLLMPLDNMVATQIEVTGTYRGMNEAPKERYTLLGAIVVNGPEGTIFIKAVGPSATMAHRRRSWELFIRNLRVLPKPERPDAPPRDSAPAPVLPPPPTPTPSQPPKNP